MALTCVTRNVFSILPLPFFFVKEILPLLVILTILPFSSSISPSDKVTQPLVNQLCSEPTIYKHFCAAWLSSDPKTFTLDFTGLVDMVLQKTEVLGVKNLEMMKGLARTTTYPKLLAPYESCVKEYESSVQAIGEAKGFARSKNYVSTSKELLKAFDSISWCEALLEGLTMPANVSTRNLWFERMCNIDRIFSDHLAFHQASSMF